MSTLDNINENIFAEFIPEESFTIDDSSKYIVYPQLSKRKINGKFYLVRQRMFC